MNKNSIISTLEYPDTKTLEEYYQKRYDSNFHCKELGHLQNRNNSTLSNKIGNIYKIDDDILHYLFENYKDNSPSHIEYVYFKVKLLNDFYSTGIRDIYTVTEQLVNIPGIDALLKEGSFYAVEKIRNIFKNDEENRNVSQNNRDIYSFATKYCYFSNPSKYSIYDKYVGFLLSDYICKDKLYQEENIKSILKNKYESIYENICNNKKPSKMKIRNSLRDYDLFMAYLDVFINKCNLDECEEQRTKIDNFLWLAGMMKYRKKNSNVANAYNK